MTSGIGGRFAGLWFQQLCKKVAPFGQVPTGWGNLTLQQQRLMQSEMSPQIRAWEAANPSNCSAFFADIRISTDGQTCMRPGMPCLASAGIGGRFCASTSPFICCGNVWAQGACSLGSSTGQSTDFANFSLARSHSECCLGRCIVDSTVAQSAQYISGDEQQQKSHVSGEDLVQQHAIGVHVRAIVDRLPFQHLGRGVPQCVRVPVVSSR